MWVKKLSGALGNGMWLSGRPELEPLSLERDWPEIERMLEQEEWPFVRADFDVSHSQPKATSLVARKHGRFAGFFSTHHFGDVGYLDMMVISSEFRGHGIARPLYYSTIRALRKKGIKSFVVHSTNDSARLFRLIGLRPGQSFTLLARDPSAAAASTAHDLTATTDVPTKALIDLDQAVFGAPRPSWQDALVKHSDVTFLGFFRAERLVASLCLRPRRAGAVCFDQVNVLDLQDLPAVVDAAVAHASHQRLKCFAKTNSALHRLLLARGFSVPPFFHAIGPLVEWRKGQTGELGLGERVQSLGWL